MLADSCAVSEEFELFTRNYHPYATLVQPHILSSAVFTLFLLLFQSYVVLCHFRWT